MKVSKLMSNNTSPTDCATHPNDYHSCANTKCPLFSKEYIFILNPVVMKFTLVCFLFVCFSLQVLAQYDPDKMFYLQKVEKYRRMKNTGAVLTVAGSILTVAGIATLLNSSYIETSNGYQTTTTTEGNPGLGVAMWLVGIGGLGSGIPLWAVGAHNHKKYSHKLEGVSIRLNMSPQRAGVTLAYRL